MTNDELDDYECCYECSGLGDDYYIDENGGLVCACSECSMNPEGRRKDK